MVRGPWSFKEKEVMDTVSLVVPVKNEEKSIQHLIDSITSQSVQPGEVIFVDGGSRDKTTGIIERNISSVPYEVTLVKADRAYPGEARNIGVRKSSNDIIAFTDAGIILDKNWLKELLARMDTDSSVDVVYGSYEPVVDSFIKECSLVAFVPPKENVNGQILRTDFIASSLFKKHICEDVGGFPPFRAAEDRIFMERVKRSKAKIVYAAKAVVHWEIPGSIKGIFRRFSEFSAHDIIAGKMKDWHYSVFRTYALLAACTIMGIILNPIFFFGIAVIWGARFALTLYRKKTNMKKRYLTDIRYLMTILYIILVTDIAMFFGCFKYIRMRYDKYA